MGAVLSGRDFGLSLLVLWRDFLLNFGVLSALRSSLTESMGVIDSSLLVHHESLIQAEMHMTAEEVIRKNLADAAHQEGRAVASEGAGERPEVELILTAYDRAEMPREWYGSELRKLDGQHLSCIDPDFAHRRTCVICLPFCVSVDRKSRKESSKMTEEGVLAAFLESCRRHISPQVPALTTILTTILTSHHNPHPHLATILTAAGTRAGAGAAVR